MSVLRSEGQRTTTPGLVVALHGVTKRTTCSGGEGEHPGLLEPRSGAGRALHPRPGLGPPSSPRTKNPVTARICRCSPLPPGPPRQRRKGSKQSPWMKHPRAAVQEILRCTAQELWYTVHVCPDSQQAPCRRPTPLSWGPTHRLPEGGMPRRERSMTSIPDSKHRPVILTSSSISILPLKYDSSPSTAQPRRVPPRLDAVRHPATRRNVPTHP